MRGRATETRRSRNSYIRRPRRVTLHPISLPWRSRNPETETFALVITGRWPLIRPRLSTAVSSKILSWVARPTPLLTTIFSRRGIAILLVTLYFLAIAGAIVSWYCSSKRAMRAVLYGVGEGLEVLRRDDLTGPTSPRLAPHFLQ